MPSLFLIYFVLLLFKQSLQLVRCLSNITLLYFFPYIFTLVLSVLTHSLFLLTLLIFKKKKGESGLYWVLNIIFCISFLIQGFLLVPLLQSLVRWLTAHVTSAERVFRRFCRRLNIWKFCLYLWFRGWLGTAFLDWSFSLRILKLWLLYLGLAVKKPEEILTVAHLKLCNLYS